MEILTKDIANECIKLRKNGMTYATIAKVMGLTTFDVAAGCVDRIIAEKGNDLEDVLQGLTKPPSRLTPKDIKACVIFRRNGLSYAELAEKFGVTETVIAVNCADLFIGYQYECVTCHRTFSSSTPRKAKLLFCSDYCCTKWHRTHPALGGAYKRVCPVCGREFSYYDAGAARKYCSRRCYHTAKGATMWQKHEFTSNDDQLILHSPSIVAAARQLDVSANVIRRRRRELLENDQTLV